MAGSQYRTRCRRRRPSGDSASSTDLKPARRQDVGRGDRRRAARRRARRLGRRRCTSLGRNRAAGEAIAIPPYMNAGKSRREVAKQAGWAYVARQNHHAPCRFYPAAHGNNLPVARRSPSAARSDWARGIDGVGRSCRAPKTEKAFCSTSTRSIDALVTGAHPPCFRGARRCGKGCHVFNTLARACSLTSLPQNVEAQQIWMHTYRVFDEAKFWTRKVKPVHRGDNLFFV